MLCFLFPYVWEFLLSISIEFYLVFTPLLIIVSLFQFGMRALHFAVQLQNEPIAKALLEAGADVNAVNDVSPTCYEV